MTKTEELTEKLDEHFAFTAGAEIVKLIIDSSWKCVKEVELPDAPNTWRGVSIDFCMGFKRCLQDILKRTGGKLWREIEE